MNLQRFLNSIAPLSPKLCKVHLACAGRSGDTPLDQLLAGNFKEYQEYQTRKNFGRPMVLSLVELPCRDRWLYAGVYKIIGVRKIPGTLHFMYETVEDVDFSEFAGRLTVRFRRPGRQSYLKAERWMESMELEEVRATKLTIPEFPGHKFVMLTKKQLDAIIREEPSSWKSALESVSGVYLVGDRVTGKLYVGSASGASGLWHRWSSYSKTGHAGNKNLKDLLRREGLGYCANFQFSILETMDTSSRKEEVLRRESFWKARLFSREHGNNGN